MSYLERARKLYLDAINDEIKSVEQATEDLRLLDGYISHPFLMFYFAMVDEYKRHEPEKGDSWLTMDISELLDLLENICSEYSRNTENDGDLVDLANVAAMIHIRRQGVLE